MEKSMYFPKGIFPCGNFPNVQILKWKLPKCVLVATLVPWHILAAALSPHCSLRSFRRSNITLGKLPLGKLHIWEVATWEIVTWKPPHNH